MLRFGTDGVRGVANVELTPELVVALGRAVARVVPSDRLVVGRDTRRSGPLLEAALVAGLTAEGVEVMTMGVVPTPAVAWVAAAEGIAGAVISASHNPFADNGVKVFGPGGRKLGVDTEAALEEQLGLVLHHGVATERPQGMDVGTVVDARDRVPGWQGALTGSLEGRGLNGLHVVVDCANGAASEVAPAVLQELGADVTVLHAEPDGSNINAGCGSTHPEDLRRTVVSEGAQVGIALDGDADRALAVDHTGRLIDGDQIIGIAAIDRQQRGLLAHDTVVVTVMSNLGLHNGMARRGIHVREVPVGDRHVLEAMAAEGISLGGEQSGHVIFADHATTGDGLLTALQVLDVVARRGAPLAELADEAMTKLPQVLVGVRVTGSAGDAVAAVASLTAEVQGELEDRGRVLVRASGTEPLVRVMVEAPSEEQAQLAAKRISRALESL